MDVRWMESPVLVVDTETTGLDFEKDEIWQLTILRFEAGKSWPDMTGWTSLFNTHKAFDPGAQALARVKPEDLEGKPFIDECLDSILGLLDEGGVFLAYNAVFDARMLRSALRRAGLDPERLPMRRSNTIDPLVFCRGLYPTIRGRTLSQMAARLGVRLKQSHDATWDAMAAAEIMVHMAHHHDLPPVLSGLIAIQEHHAHEWARRTGRPIEW